MSTSNSGKEDLTPTEIDAKLTRFEKEIDRLKHSYEMYFNGIDRIPPNQQRKDVVRLVNELEHRTFIRNTAQKFRLRSLVARFNTYKHNWDRILRAIENGTYIRDIQKARRNQKRREKEEARAEAREQQYAFELDMDMDAIDNLDAFAQEVGASIQKPSRPSPAPTSAAVPPPQQPQQPTQQQPAAQPAASGGNGGGGDDARARKIMELQAKLGLPATGSVDNGPSPAPNQPVSRQPMATSSASSGGGGEDARRAKLEAMRQRLAARSQGSNTIQGGSAQVNSGGEIRGASADRLQQLKEDKERMQRHRQSIQRGGAQRTIQRSNTQRPAASQSSGGGQDDQVKRVYRNLVEAKRRCNESTNNLSYDSVARSMNQQRERLRKSHGARDVDFKVVIKDGRAFLKPEPK
jgi:hypothetical protein